MKICCSILNWLSRVLNFPAQRDQGWQDCWGTFSPRPAYFKSRKLPRPGFSVSLQHVLAVWPWPNPAALSFLLHKIKIIIFFTDIHEDQIRWCLTKHFVNCKATYRCELLLLLISEGNWVPEGLSDSPKAMLQINAEWGLAHKSAVLLPQKRVAV